MAAKVKRFRFSLIFFIFLIFSIASELKHTFAALN